MDLWLRASFARLPPRSTVNPVCGPDRLGVRGGCPCPPSPPDAGSAWYPRCRGAPRFQLWRIGGCPQRAGRRRGSGPCAQSGSRTSGGRHTSRGQTHRDPRLPDRRRGRGRGARARGQARRAGWAVADPVLIEVGNRVGGQERGDPPVPVGRERTQGQLQVEHRAPVEEGRRLPTFAGSENAPLPRTDSTAR